MTLPSCGCALLTFAFLLRTCFVLAYITRFLRLCLPTDRLLHDSKRLPHNLVKLEMALEESNKVWLNRRVRVNPDRKFFPLKK